MKTGLKRKKMRTKLGEAGFSALVSVEHTTKRLYTGNVPEDGRFVRQLEDRYALFFRDTSDDEQWKNFKLISLKPSRKANYWLGWNARFERFAGTPDHDLLREKLPGVHKWCRVAIRVYLRNQHEQTATQQRQEEEHT